MARKTLTITIAEEGRDKGKTFRITEWPAAHIEDWVMRVIFGLGRAGVEIPPEVLRLGAGPAIYAIASQASRIPSRLGVRLADELMDCVQRVEGKLDRSLVDADTEEVGTRLRLKAETLKLMFGFFAAAASLNSSAPESGNPVPSRP